MRLPRPNPHGEANWLLQALPADAYDRIMAQCDVIPLNVRDVISQPNEPITHALFPRSGCLSIVTVMGDGSHVEVGTVGWEGMAGISIVHGITTVPTQCIVQVPGEAVQFPIPALLAELREHEELRSVLFRFAQLWMDNIGRGGSCNASHSIEERCARWLLMTHDRVSEDLLPLTQEFLAVMLGVRRASVTLAAASLQQAGLISYKHGKITVLDREALELASCECYAAMQASYARLFPHTEALLPTPSAPAES